MTKIEVADLNTISKLMQTENAKMRDDLIGTWENIFHKIFQGVEPAASTGGRPFEVTWEEGMKENYDIDAGQCGLGDDTHNMHVEHILFQ